MIVHLSGWQATCYKDESKLIAAGAILHRCVSFAYIHRIEGFPYFSPRSVEGYEACVDGGVGILMDSGVFSFRAHKRSLQVKGKDTSKLPTEEEFMRLYVAFCKKHSNKWDAYITVDLDLVAANNYKRHVQLEKMGIRPVPVLHGDDSVREYMEQYHARGYDYIAVSSPPGLGRTSMNRKRQYLDTVFNVAERLGVRVHGLAFTSPWAMITYPWYSVDSSGWSRSASLGCISRFDESTERMSVVHVSDRSSDKQVQNPAIMKAVRTHVEKEGYNWKELQTDYVIRHLFNAREMLKLAAYADSKRKNGTGGKWRSIL